LGRPSIQKETEESDTRFWCHEVVKYSRAYKFKRLNLSERKKLEGLTQAEQDEFLELSPAEIETILDRPPGQADRDLGYSAIKTGRKFRKWLRAGLPGGGAAMSFDQLQSFVRTARLVGLLPPRRRGGVVLDVEREERIVLGESGKPGKRSSQQFAEHLQAADLLFHTHRRAVAALEEYAAAIKSAVYVTVVAPPEIAAPAQVTNRPGDAKRFGAFSKLIQSQEKDDASVSPMFKTDDIEAVMACEPENTIYETQVLKIADALRLHDFRVSSFSFPVEWCKTGAVMIKKSSKTKQTKKNSK
jgi:hypothetical protein